MIISSKCECRLAPKLQALVKRYNLRFILNPYATSNDMCSYVIDFALCSDDEVSKFEGEWRRAQMNLVEKTRKYSAMHKIKRYFLRLVINLRGKL